MRFAPIVLLAAVGVTAHPSGHMHAHRDAHKHAKKDIAVIVTATIDGKVVSWTQGGSPFKAAHKPTPVASTSTTSSTSSSVASTTSTTSSSSSSSTTTLLTSTTTPTPSTTAAATTSSSTTTTAAAKTSAASTSSGSGSGASTYEAFASCSSSKKMKRATLADITYTGNTGCDGYGSNMKLVQSTIASKYSYSVKAVNGASSSMQCKAWNKIGPSGSVNGFFSGNEALTFTIAAGASQYVVFDSNSQGGMCCHTGSVPTTSVGEWLCAWLEFDFADTANSGWSGFDASALVAGSVGGPYNALKACTADGATCSTLDTSGGGTNAYLPGDEAADGIGGNLAAGDVSLVATWS